MKPLRRHVILADKDEIRVLLEHALPLIAFGGAEAIIVAFGLVLGRCPLGSNVESWGRCFAEFRGRWKF